MATRLSNEDTLILDCACTVLSSSASENIRKLLGTPLDWNYILNASSRHHVLPLLYRSIQKISTGSLPLSIQNTLKNDIIKITVQNLYLSSKLLKVLTLFKEQGILAVPFKGPILAQLVYGDIGLRSFGDLDILIKAKDVTRASTTLEYAGYIPAIDLSPSQYKSYIKTEDDMVFIHKEDGCIIELHWEMSGRYLFRPLDMAFISNRLQSVTFLDKDVAHLSPEDNLIYLCIHGSRHMWDRLEWICGLAELIRINRELQWKLILQLAQKLKCKRILYQSLYLAYELMDTDIPSLVLKEIEADPSLPHLVDKVKMRLFPLYRKDNNAEKGLRFNSYQFLVRDSIIDQIKYGWRQLIIPREADWRWFPLPASLAFMYCILRPMRLTLQFLKGFGPKD